MASRLETEKTEERQLLTIFPAEIWQNTMGLVNNSKCYTNISSASPYLQTLLLPHRTQILLAELLPFYLGPYQPCANQALPLRQVCRRWKESVDEYLVQQPLNFISQYPDPERKSEGSFHQTECFKKPEHFTRFEQHFDSSHLKHNSNPFLYRSVELLCMPTSCYQNFLEPYITAMLPFLEKYGVFVWFLKFYFQITTWNELQSALEVLPCCLSLMPNIKSIKLEVECCLYGKNKQQNQAVVNIPNFPVLCDLQFVSLASLPLQLLKSFVSANPQVKAVEILDEHTPEIITFHLEEWPNLTAIIIHLKSGNGSFEALRDARVSCPLTKLQINAQDLVDVSWESIFGVLEQNFGNTLEQLYIRLPDNKAQDAPPELKLHKLKILNLHLKKIVRLDFLLPMVDTMEQFTLTAMQRIWTRDFDHGLLDLYKVWYHPEKCNMWKVFPKLKRLRTCNGYSYREGEEDVLMWNVATRNQWKETQNHT